MKYEKMDNGHARLSNLLKNSVLWAKTMHEKL